MVKAIWYFTTFSSGKKGKDKHKCDFLVTSKINIENIYINDQKKKKITKVIYVFNKTPEIKHCFGMTKGEKTEFLT